MRRKEEPACLEGEKRNLSTIFYERVEIFLLVFLFLIKMYEKEKAVKSKIVKSLTAKREKKTMTTAPAAPHGGVATKHRRQPYWKVAVAVGDEDGDGEEVGDGDRVGNGGKMELPQGSRASATWKTININNNTICIIRSTVSWAILSRSLCT